MNEPWAESAGIQLHHDTSRGGVSLPLEWQRQVLGTIGEQAQECHQLLADLQDEWDHDAVGATAKACEAIRRAQHRIHGMFAHLDALAWNLAPPPCKAALRRVGCAEG